MRETIARERVEAVIISGPRRGEIVTLEPGEQVLTSEQLDALLLAFRELNAAFAGLVRQTDGLNEKIHGATERV